MKDINLDDFKANYKDSSIPKDANDSKVEKWEAIRDSKPYGTEVAHKSKYVSDLTKSLLDWQIPSIVEPLVNSKDLINCKPFTFADTAISEQDETVLTYQFVQTLDHYTFISNLVTYIAEKGTAFVKTGWLFEEEEQEVEVPIVVTNPMSGQDEVVGTRVETQMVTLVNRPTRDLVDPADLRIDPTCGGDISKAEFIIHDFELSISDLKKDGRYENLDKVEADVIKAAKEDDDNFTFDDLPRKKVVVHEYWGNYDLNEDGIVEPVLIAWIGDIAVRAEDNPLPGQELPFARAVYKNIPGENWGEPLAAKTAKHQHIDSVLHRGIFDDMKLANNGQTGTKKGFADQANLRKMKQGLDFEYNTTMADVYQDQYRGLNNSVFTILDRNVSSAQAAVGVNLLNHGAGGNALGSSAAAVTATTTSSAKREMHIVRGIAEQCLIPILRKFLQYNREFLSREEIERITDKPYVDSQSNSQYDVKIVIESAETRAAKAQSAGFVLQTMGPSMPQEIQMKLLARYMKLVGEPDIAKDLENYKPQPDPMQQQAQQLELAKLGAQVKNETAKAEENQVDKALKLAKVRELNSKSDLKDLEFLEQESGIKQQRVIDLQDNKDLNEIDKKNAVQG